MGLNPKMTDRSGCAEKTLEKRIKNPLQDQMFVESLWRNLKFCDLTRKEREMLANMRWKKEVSRLLKTLVY